MKLRSWRSGRLQGNSPMRWLMELTVRNSSVVQILMLPMFDSILFSNDCTLYSKSSERFPTLGDSLFKLQVYFEIIVLPHQWRFKENFSCSARMTIKRRCCREATFRTYIVIKNVHTGRYLCFCFRRNRQNTKKLKLLKLVAFMRRNCGSSALAYNSFSINVLSWVRTNIAFFDSRWTTFLLSNYRSNRGCLRIVEE